MESIPIVNTTIFFILILLCAGINRQIGVWMQKQTSEGIASHAVPESWGSFRNGRLQALTGVRTGQVLSPEIIQPGAHALKECAKLNGQQSAIRNGESCWYLAGSKTLCVFRNNLRENREIPWSTSGAMPLVRIVKSKDTRR